MLCIKAVWVVSRATVAGSTSSMKATADEHLAQARRGVVPVTLGGEPGGALQAVVRDQRPALCAQVHGPEEEVLRKLVSLLYSAQCGQDQVHNASAGLVWWMLLEGIVEASSYTCIDGPMHTHRLETWCQELM